MDSKDYIKKKQTDCAFSVMAHLQLAKSELHNIDKIGNGDVELDSKVRSDIGRHIVEVKNAFNKINVSDI